MIRTIIGFCLLIGLITPSITGSETTETTIPTSFASLVERGMKTQANIIEHNLLSYMGRHDTLTARSRQIDQFSQLFEAHFGQGQQTRAGYGIILEDILAHPDSKERALRLSEMEELIGLVNSGILDPETLNYIKEKLDQQKQSVLSVRIGVIMQRQKESQALKQMNAALLAQIKTVFENDLEKLRHYRDEETVSRWTLESPLPTSADSASAIETPLPILADVIRDYIELNQAIKDEELAYLRENIALLSRNRDQLTAILEELGTLEETSQRNKMIAALKEDISRTSFFIQREQERLTSLGI